MLYRYAAFADHASGGNPAGVWIGDTLPDATTMQRIAAEVGYSETAFLAPANGARRTVRYYSPEAEVSFCGHATIASGVVLADAEGPGAYVLDTAVGEVPVDVVEGDGGWWASLTSVTPRHELAEAKLVRAVLDLLGWRRDELDPAIAPARAYGGAWHLILAAAEHRRLAALEYPFEALKSVMLAEDLTTVSLIWRESSTVIHARNPFPVGGVVEDPATGAAAAALGGYLRDSGVVQPPADVLIRQGEAMGRPSRLLVQIPTSGGIVVRGSAVPIP